MKNKQGLRLTVILMIFLLSIGIFNGCSAKSSMETTTADTMTSTEMSTVGYAGAAEESKAMESPASATLDMDVQVDGMMGDVAVSSNTTTPPATENATNASLQTQADNRMYIRTFNFQIETLEFDTSVAALDNLVNKYFGFFQSTEVTGRSLGYSNAVSRQGIYTIRIPKEKAGDFLKGLVGIGNVLDSSSYVEDVTSTYVDINARIKTLKVQEDRLIAILEKATELQYILELERELSSVRYEIESYSSSLRDLEGRVNYTTIYVTMNEVFETTEIVTEPKTFIDKIVDGFTRSLKDVINYLENVVIFFITNIPSFILLAVNLFIIYIVIRLLLKTKLLRKLFMLDDRKKHTESAFTKLVNSGEDKSIEVDHEEKGQK